MRITIALVLNAKALMSCGLEIMSLTSSLKDPTPSPSPLPTDPLSFESTINLKNSSLSLCHS